MQLWKVQFSTWSLSIYFINDALCNKYHFDRFTVIALHSRCVFTEIRQSSTISPNYGLGATLNKLLKVLMKSVALLQRVDCQKFTHSTFTNGYCTSGITAKIAKNLFSFAS